MNLDVKIEFTENELLMIIIIGILEYFYCIDVYYSSERCIAFDGEINIVDIVSTVQLYLDKFSDILKSKYKLITSNTESSYDYVLKISEEK